MLVRVRAQANSNGKQCVDEEEEEEEERTLPLPQTIGNKMFIRPKGARVDACELQCVRSEQAKVFGLTATIE